MGVSTLVIRCQSPLLPGISGHRVAGWFDNQLVIDLESFSLSLNSSSQSEAKFVSTGFLKEISQLDLSKN